MNEDIYRMSLMKVKLKFTNWHVGINK